MTKNYLYKLNREIDPYYVCGEVEDLNHMFLECRSRIIPNLDNEFRKVVFESPLTMQNIIRNLNEKTSV